MGINESAQKLSRNPLGIIALFILLIYGFATLLFGFTATNITELQKWPFIIFIVVFPILVLFVFYSLVRNHHKKLYAPMDYRDEKHFMQYQTESEKEQKLDKEINAEIVSTEIQNMPDGLTREEPTVNLRQKITKFEDLALNQLENEYKVEIKRNVYFGVKNRDRGFDGFAELKNQMIFFEVKYLRRGFFPISILESVIYKAVSVKQELMKHETFITTKFKLVIALVMDMDEDQSLILKKHVNKYLDSELMDIEIKYIKANELERNS